MLFEGEGGLLHRVVNGYKEMMRCFTKTRFLIIWARMEEG